MKIAVYQACFLVASSLAPLAATAQTTTATFGVTITIEAECVVNTAKDLNFGSTGVLADAVDATATLEVTCTNGTDYNIGLNNGMGAGATTDARQMISSGGGGGVVTYALYLDANRSSVWGDTVGSNVRAATGTGAVQTYDVHGRVPAQATPPGGTYSDTVGVTVTY